MLNFVGNLIGNNSARFIADFVAVIYKFVGVRVINFFKNLFVTLLNLVAKYIWFVCKWVLAAIDVMQVTFTRLIGLENGETTLGLGDYVEGLKSIHTTTGSNYYNYLMKIFRAVFAVAIVLMIVFTIIAMVKQEYKLATEGYAEANNSKGKFLKIMLKNIIVIFLMPLIFYTLIVGTNSILSAFYRALGNDVGTSIGGNVLAASTYDANRYRTYANANKRIPITISVYTSENTFGKTLSDDELMKEIKKSDVQTKLKAIAGAFANDSFLPFEESTICNNGTWGNYENYDLTVDNTVYTDMGRYFENFICTREQYYVMADFVDFCQRYNINYYIKSMTESDICWKYVDGLTVGTDIDEDGNAIGDITLNVTYRNAEKINNPTATASAANGLNDDSYSLQITTKLDMTSPISDALTTASKLLGIDEDNSKFNAMERDDSGDFVNLVEWSTRKAKLQLSTGFNLSTPSTWTFSDQIIVYEYYRYQNDYASTNNDLEDYTLEQIKTSGAFLDALEMTYRNYNSNTHTYSDAKTQYCVKINGHYYKLKESETEFDNYGHAYFELDVLDKYVNYFTDALVSIEKTGGTYKLKLGSGFNINDSSTWAIGDQVLLYEFCKNLGVSDRTLSDEMVENHMFDDFKAGVDFDVYTINSSEYININGTYYQTSGFLNSSTKTNESGAFLIDTSAAGERWFGYNLSCDERDKFGINNLDALVGSPSSVEEIDDSDAYYQKYTAQKFKLSENFSLTSTENWTFRDFAIIYLYINYFASNSSVTIESLKNAGLRGDIVRSDSTYYLCVKDSSGGSGDVYVNLANLEKTSELSIMSTLSTEMFDSMSLGLSGVNLVSSYNKDLDSDKLLNAKVSTHTFSISENFDRYEADTWTNGDYLLIYLTEKGYIDAEISILQHMGYSAMVYTVDANRDGKDENYYRFGKTTKTATGETLIDDNAYFLNEYELELMGYTVDKWFNTNLLSYLLLQCYSGITLDDVIVDEDDFGGGVLDNQESFIYNSTSATNTKSLQWILGKELLSSGELGILTDDSLFEYTYSNPALVENDLSTWTGLDTIIYTKTGELPTVNKPYETSIVSLSGDNYIVIDDILVNISSGNFSCSYSYFNMLVSKHTSAYTLEKDMTARYDIFAETIIDGTGLTLSGGEVYYYSNSLQGSGNATFETNISYTDFDLLLIKSEHTLTSSGYYTFNIYTNTSDNKEYIKIKDGVYYPVSYNTNAYIYVKKNALTSIKYAFTEPTNPDDREYTSFNSENAAMDSLVYKLTGVQEKTTYKIYNLRNDGAYGGAYIRLANGKILKYITTEPTAWKKEPSEMTAAEAETVYNKYYSGYVFENITATEYTNGGSLLSGISDNYSTALGLILKQNGKTLNGCGFAIGANGAYYLTFTDDGIKKYIELKDLVSVVVKYSGTSLTSVELTNINQDTYKTNCVSALNDISTSYLTFAEARNINTFAVIDITSTGANDARKVAGTYRNSVLNSNDWSDWSVAGLISVYVDPNGTFLEKINGTYVYRYYYGNNANYVAFKSADVTYYIPFTSTTNTKLFNNLGAGDADSYFADGGSKSVATNSEIYLILKNKFGFDDTEIGNVILSYIYSGALKNADGKKIEFYQFENDNKVYYFYGASNTASASANAIKFAKFNGKDTAVTWVDSLADASTFTLLTKSMDECTQWNIFDLVMSYATGISSRNLTSSAVYQSKSRYYIKYNDKYVLLPSALGETSFNRFLNKKDSAEITGDSVTIFSSLSSLYAEDVADSRYTTENELSSLFSYKTYIESEDIYIAGYTDVLLSYGQSVVDGNVVTAGSLSPERFGFSSTFNVNDYSSWTMSDYVLYYAITSGTYIHKDAAGNDVTGFSFKFPFTYMPSFTKSGDKYYNLTYLDSIMVLFSGGKSLISQTDDEKTALMNSLSDPIEFYLCYDSSYNFYLYAQINGKQCYIALSSDISVDFVNMKVVSETIDVDYTFDALANDVGDLSDATPATLVNGRFEKAWINGATGTTINNYYTVYDANNFQTFVAGAGAPAYVCYLYKENASTGSVECNKVVKFTTSEGLLESGDCYMYDKFYAYYGQTLSQADIATEQIYTLTVDISNATFGNTVELKLLYNYEDKHADIEFDDYYYFKFGETYSTLTSNVVCTDETVKNAINSYTTDSEGVIVKKEINLRLSSTELNIASVSSWTYLDYIILYEMSRNMRNNVFKGLTVNELKTDDYYLDCAYVIGADADENIYLKINNNFYKVTGKVKYNDDTTKEYLVNDASTKVSASAIKAGSVNEYDFKVLNNTHEYSINQVNLIGTNPKVAVYSADSKDVISYFTNDGKTINYKYIDTNVAETNYRIKTSDYAAFSVSTIIKNVSWVEKLMNDMQVYYPDLNWGVLIATDGWLDTLGEFTSAHTSGLFVGGDNSANTTAAGLVLSEFFMSVATPVNDSYADYEYTSVFDEDTIRALMLSLVGEDSYQALVFEAKVFMDYFNSCFAPIIDDFAREFGEDIGENSLRLNAYKSYLATLLLSSDIGEYLYTVATRVYAEYTICEYLASAAGDYSGYYSYVNNLTDENGKTIDAYNFGSFYELVQYENEYCGSANPTFTFNFKKAFDAYKDGTTQKVAGFTYDQAIGNFEIYTAVTKQLVKKLNNDYENIYESGNQISESGKVVDGYGNSVNDTNEYVFCYMIHVYWMIKNDISGLIDPIYLQFYKDYIDGDLARWDIIKGENIETADQYYEHYYTDVTKLTLYKNLSYVSALGAFIPSVSFSTESLSNLADNFFETLKDYVDVFTGLVNVAKGEQSIGSWLVKDYGGYLGQVFVNDTEAILESVASARVSLPMMDAYNLMSKNDSLKGKMSFIISNAFSLYFTMGFSEDSGFKIIEIIKKWVRIEQNSQAACWETINTYYDCVCDVVDELIAIRDLLPGEKTENGCTRDYFAGLYYTDEQLDITITTFQNLQNNLNQYIAAQTRIDQMQKRSVTFTLAQFGSNYVSTGYEFSVRNKSYTFKPSTDPSRLAEYVYGGSFLESVGVGAQYTDPDFDGIIKASKVYDSSDNALKTNLDSWLELRTFLSEIADKTAELYYLTNLKDLDINTKNAVYMSDLISIKYDVDAYNSVEAVLYEYISGELGATLVNRITDGKTDTHEKFVAVSNYLFLNSVEESEFDQMTLEEYKRIVIQQVIANKQNGDESAEERATRYMTLFNLLSVQVEYSGSSSGAAGRIIPKANITRSGNSITYENKVKITTYGVEVNSEATVVPYATETLTGTLSFSDNTAEMIKTLSGLENRPTREVLTREYAGIKSGDYFDEAYGDTFIACFYDETTGLYYPALGSNTANCTETKFQQFFNDKKVQKHEFVSQYYNEKSNLVICKGIITADGNPTAIRKYNNPLTVEQKRLFNSSSVDYNAVTFYRTDVGALLGAGDDAIQASRAVSRVTTKNYTKYMYGTSYTKGIGSTTTYTGKTNLKTFVSSNVGSYYVQSKTEYLITQADEHGGISIVDEFSYYYIFGGQSWILLFLAFVTIIPVMINAVGGAASRMFNLIILFLVSPAVISTNSLYGDSKNKGYDMWKKNLQSSLLGMLGYIIGFSFFSIMVPVIYNIDTFISIDTFNKIQSIAGIGSFVTYPAVNALLRCLWMITAVSILERIPKLLLPIITAGYGDLNSPHPSLGEESKSFIDKTKALEKDMEKTLSQVQSVVSGKALMGFMEEAKSQALSMIPGYDIAKQAKEKFVDPIVNKIKDELMKLAQKAMEEFLKSQGVDPATAKMASTAAAETVKQTADAGKKQKERMKKYQDEFKKNFN